MSKQYKDNIYTGCLAIKTVTVPKKMKTVNGIMKGVTSLVEWKTEADCENFKAVDGVLFSKDGKTLDVIPFDSTRIYVDRVLKYYEKYEEVYAKS